jgi:segregation and condensation protein B
MSEPPREIPVPPLLDREQAKRIVEGLLFVSSEPLSLRRIAYVIPELDPAAAKQIVEALMAEYQQQQRAFAIKEIAGGYQLKTDAALAPWMQRALHQVKSTTVSKAALETLAIIAYRQPLTKAEVEAIRGVDSGAALETLLERGFVQVVGKKETPGRPFLYGTTSEFLRHFGLQSLEALPQPHLPVVAEPGGDATEQPAELQADEHDAHRDEPREIVPQGIAPAH